MEVGAGAGRPGDLARAQGRGHDEAARAAAVTGLLPIMSHAETEYNDVSNYFERRAKGNNMNFFELQLTFDKKNCFIKVVLQLT